MGKNLDVTMLLDFYGEMLSEKQQSFISYYYNDDLSLAEIADNEGITRQGVRDAIKRAETQLFDMEERLGLVARFQDMESGLEEIIAKADNISQLNRDNAFSKDIEADAQRIRELATRIRENEI